MERIRLKSGRLGVRERRRRLSAANLRDGEVILLDETRRRSRTKGRSGNSISVEFHAKGQWAVDTDIRKLLHRIRLALARHYQAQLLAGRRPDSDAPLPALEQSTLDRTPRRKGDFGVVTGELAERWLLLAIRGGPLKASTIIKPWGGKGRRFAINGWLRRGIDLQSIRGSAAKVIDEEIRAWLREAVPASGNGVGTPATVPHGGGELPRFRSEP